MECQQNKTDEYEKSEILKTAVELPKIYVTGFGPFVGHEKVNASWEAVKLLPDILKYKNKQYKLEKLEVPVVYEDVDRTVSEIWKDDPLLVIHCGVHGKTKQIKLEKCAYNSNFCRLDFSRKCLPNKKADLCKNGQCSTVLNTNIDVDKIAEELNLESPSAFCSSTTVGNYLCGYMYLKSLDCCMDRTLFIHVPPVDRPFSSLETREGIWQIIEKCLDQIDSSN